MTRNFITGALCLSFALVSCTHTHKTTVRAVSLDGNVDKEVKIYADDLHQNNKYIGSGEAQYSSKKVYGKLFQNLQPSIKLKKPGCLTVEKPLDLMEDKETKRLYWLFYGLSFATLIPLAFLFVVRDSLSQNETYTAAFASGLLILAGSAAAEYYKRQSYTFKPVHNIEFVCATEAAKIIR